MTNEPKQVIPEDGLVNAIGDESRAIVVGPPAAPLTYEDLLRVFEKECPAEMAAELAAGLTPSRPAASWTSDILLG